MRINGIRHCLCDGFFTKWQILTSVYLQNYWDNCLQFCFIFRTMTRYCKKYLLFMNLWNILPENVFWLLPICHFCQNILSVVTVWKQFVTIVTVRSLHVLILKSRIICQWDMVFNKNLQSQNKRICLIITFWTVFRKNCTQLSYLNVFVLVIRYFIKYM